MQGNKQLLQQAHALGINRLDYRSRILLIRAVQKGNGHEPCCATDERDYCVKSCQWCKPCKGLIAAWLR